MLRLAIYLPLLGFFGWRAAARYMEAREAADEAFRQSVNQWLTHPPRTIDIDGQQVPVLEVTEAEAAALGYLPASDAKPEAKGEGAEPAAEAPVEPAEVPVEPASAPAEAEAEPAPRPSPAELQPPTR